MAIDTGRKELWAALGKLNSEPTWAETFFRSSGHRDSKSAEPTIEELREEVEADRARLKESEAALARGEQRIADDQVKAEQQAERHKKLDAARKQREALEREIAQLEKEP